jgi:hypothetical protein
MLVSVYIRKSDENKWKALENKTQAISDLLNRGTLPPAKPKQASTEPPGVVEETDEYEPDYSGYVYDPYTNAVYDRETKEQVPATPEMIKALKKR